MKVNKFAIAYYEGRKIRLYFIACLCFAATGCGQGQAGVEERMKNLENRVNFLESALARYEGTESGSPIISTGSRQGFISGGSANTSQAVESSVKGESQKQAYSGRCQATTKKGSQCKRSASGGSSHCWQHS